MSGPFSPVSPTGQPVWAVQVPTAGNFSPVNVLGFVTVPEVGYGQGGYGQGGYDTPTQIIPAAGTPAWIVGSPR